MADSTAKSIHKILEEDSSRGKPEVKRSPKWVSVRKKHLKNNGFCVACGATEHLQVHHLKPFHLFPELELEPSNLITLCEKVIQDEDTTNDNHHLVLGHRGNFHKNNENVLKDINNYRVKKANLPLLEGYDFKNCKKIV